LNRSPVLKPIDAQPVWSVVCFFVEKRNEGKGISKALIQGARQYVASQGGELLEAYPTVPRGVGLLPPVSSFMGIQKSLARAGFVEVARASRAKSIMRYQVPRSKEQR
jgi:GNAT superfamily N-acetyltransferase